MIFLINNDHIKNILLAIFLIIISTNVSGIKGLYVIFLFTISILILVLKQRGIINKNSSLRLFLADLVISTFFLNLDFLNIDKIKYESFSSLISRINELSIFIPIITFFIFDIYLSVFKESNYNFKEFSKKQTPLSYISISFCLLESIRGVMAVGLISQIHYFIIICIVLLPCYLLVKLSLNDKKYIQLIPVLIYSIVIYISSSFFNILLITSSLIYLLKNNIQDYYFSSNKPLTVKFPNIYKSIFIAINLFILLLFIYSFNTNFFGFSSLDSAFEFKLSMNNSYIKSCNQIKSLKTNNLDNYSTDYANPIFQNLRSKELNKIFKNKKKSYDDLSKNFPSNGFFYFNCTKNNLINILLYLFLFFSLVIIYFFHGYSSSILYLLHNSIFLIENNTFFSFIGIIFSLSILFIFRFKSNSFLSNKKNL